MMTNITRTVRGWLSSGIRARLPEELMVIVPVSGDSVNKDGNGGRYSNDIKVDIPEYDGKLDPDEFVEWLRTVELHERRGKEKIQTWLKMKEKRKQKFLPSYYIQASFSQLHSLRQGTCTAEDYSREFEYLLMKCDNPEDDPQTLDVGSICLLDECA
ncbi:hypothetical protein CTI12_AA424500 [Artemisia annua]|uniref:Retrotransposon gag domain-containing protein n=1 Tax=Artemisia annua TaxID=35608 RepID=A0A2U1M3J1_ARTAN|nr:hypothetical protein CTI12_AA424500 [Artemisia annua]